MYTCIYTFLCTNTYIYVYTHVYPPKKTLIPTIHFNSSQHVWPITTLSLQNTYVYIYMYIYTHICIHLYMYIQAHHPSQQLEACVAHQHNIIAKYMCLCAYLHMYTHI